MARPALTDPPGELMYRLMSRLASSADSRTISAQIRLASSSSTCWPRKMIRCRSRRWKSASPICRMGASAVRASTRDDRRSWGGVVTVPSWILLSPRLVADCDHNPQAELASPPLRPVRCRRRLSWTGPRRPSSRGILLRRGRHAGLAGLDRAASLAAARPAGAASLADLGGLGGLGGLGVVLALGFGDVDLAAGLVRHLRPLGDEAECLGPQH